MATRYQRLPYDTQQLHIDLIAKGWSQRQLADRIGVSTAAVSALFARGRGSARVLCAVSAALGHPVDRYLTRVDDSK